MASSWFSCGILAFALLMSAPSLRADPLNTTYDRYIATGDLMKKATRLLAEGRLKDAKDAFEACVRQVPDHYEAHYFLAQLAYESRDYPAALTQIQIAIHSLGEMARSFDHETAASQKRIAARRAEYQHVLDQIMQQIGGSGACRAATVIDARQSIQALDQEADSSNGGAKPFAIPAAYYFVEGNCLLRLHRNAEAREQYTKAIQTDPKHAESWNNLTYLWFADHDVAKARETLQRAEALGVTLNPALKQAILEAGKKDGAR